MSNINLYNRNILPKIIPFLDTKEAILLIGARQVGKTTIMKILKNELEKQSKKTIFLDLEDFNILNTLNSGVDAFINFLKLSGAFNEKSNEKLYIFLDEIQYLENPSNFIKLLVDHYPNIKLILSGSSNFALQQKMADSLVGRIIKFEIFNLSFKEFLNFKNEKIDLSIKTLDDFNLQKLKQLYTEYFFFGGYPQVVLAQTQEQKEMYLKSIIDTYIKKDIRDLANIKDVNKFNKLITILAGQSGNLLNINELSNTLDLAKETLEKYILILEQTYIIKLVKPFSNNLRSELTKTPKIFFYDTGLLHQILFATTPKTIQGNIFETSIFIELAKSIGTDYLFYWRTTNKQEIDFIINKGQKIIPIEVKINFNQFKLSNIKSFLDKYNLQNYYIASIDGTKKSNNYLYAWECAGLGE